jgi:para-aminobenzoate synthetase component I
MEVIDELEPTSRNLYTGSIGYIADSGDIDLNIVIRTLFKYINTLHYQVGGGIVWDSQVDMEYDECLTKGLALKRAIYNDYSLD